MNDWRNKPRIGKSQFIPHLGEITERHESGQTAKQIYDHFIKLELIEMSYAQFTRYLRVHVKKTTPVVNKPEAITVAPAASSPIPKPQITARPGNGDRRREDFQHNPVPDRNRIYGET